jgi:hypothetical protein
MTSTHLQTLAAAMAPNPGEWAYARYRDRGDANGTCACGHHGVRHEHIIGRLRDGRELVIGSHCIETTVPYLIAQGAPELAEQLRSEEAKRKLAAARARRESDAEQVVSILERDVKALKNWFFRAREIHETNHGQRPAELVPAPDLPAERGQTAAEYVNKLRRVYRNGWWRAVEFASDHTDAPLPPLPNEPKVKDSLRVTVMKARDDRFERRHLPAKWADTAFRARSG